MLVTEHIEPIIIARVQNITTCAISGNGATARGDQMTTTTNVPHFYNITNDLVPGIANP